jgi:tRNA (guanine10-N2)-dimethyltransferase
VRQVLLSGEHATLPAAELRAVLAVHDPTARIDVEGRFALVSSADSWATDAALARLALAHAWVEPWGAGPDDADGHAVLAGLIEARAEGGRSAAVRTTRLGDAKSAHSLHLERILGAALGRAGHPIHLAAPEMVLAAWLHEGRVVMGEELGRIDRARFERRTVGKRAHFRPVTLHPRRAAALVNLARVPVGGTIHDPFCGTGTFVLEAALAGYRASGSDLDEAMVQGTLQALADDGPEPLAGDAFVADIGAVPALLGSVEGIVSDVPYGRASTTDREAPQALYQRAMAACGELLKPGGRAVLGAPDASLATLAPQHGFAVAEHHTEYVHRSLTRHYVVLERLPVRRG